MVDHPDPAPASTDAYDRGAGGMPKRTRRAFRSHYNQHLDGLVERAVREIELVYGHDPDAVVSVSGGKDSMATLALAAAADVDHRVLHWDYGPDFLPRRMEREILSNIQAYAEYDQLYVSNELMRTFRPIGSADPFHRQLQTDTRLSDRVSVRDEPGMKGVSRLAPRLRRARESNVVGRQILGTRKGESGSRDRYIDGLYGESLGEPGAFPIRGWSARDVWAYIVGEDVPYPAHYDRHAASVGTASPQDYEQVRLGGLFRWTGSGVEGLSHWRDRDIESREWERAEHRRRRGQNE